MQTMIRSFIVLGAMIAASEAQTRVPVQTYFVPLPEEGLLKETFVRINDGSQKGIEGAQGPVNTMIAIAVAADQTVIWYDHWEDGFEADVTDAGMQTTEIWGDGDCANGFAPNIKGVKKECKTPEDDVLFSGDAVLLDNFVPVGGGRDPTKVFYDGRDKIQSSFPIAITRAAYPKVPGSLMAGAVEVLDTSTWGTEFVAPVGADTVEFTTNDPFEYTALYVMACKDGTEVKVNDEIKGVINQGENMIVYPVNEGDKVVTSKISQVDILAGDMSSSYELRWYSLIPLSSWSDDYYTPVGGVETEGPVGKFRVSDAERQTKVWLYNPNKENIAVKYMFKAKTGFEKKSVLIKNGSSKESINIPVGSGGRFFTEDGSKFFALTQTSTDGTGQNFDWGHPLVPANMLTSQVLVGWGYGCEGNDCTQGGDIAPFKGSRSVVWVTPLERANINVDYDGDGVIDETIKAKPLSSVRISAPDNDMTGALIFATTNKGEPVKIVSAWGQDPSKSTFVDASAMDLGTVIPPLPIIEAGKSCTLETDMNNDGLVSAGDILRYTIRVVNSGRVDLPAESFSIYDFAAPLLDETIYVPDSTTYTSYTQAGAVNFQTSVGGTSFPLDDGVLSMADLSAGGVHEISFSVKIKSVGDITPGTESVINKGVVSPPGLPGSPIAIFDEEKTIVVPETTTTTTTTSTTTTTTTTTTPEPTTTTTTTTTPEPTTTSTTTTTTTPEPTTTTTTTTTTTPEPTTTSTTTTTPEPTTTSTTTTTPEPITTTTTTTTTTLEPTTSSGPNPIATNPSTTQAPKDTTECPLTPAIDGPECRPLLVGNGVEIGKVCARIVDDNLEITKHITSGVCCLTECHICNLPVKQFLVDDCVQDLGPIVIPISVVYQFVCAFDEDEFLVAGHATAICDAAFDSDGVVTADDALALQKEKQECTAYYEIPLKCQC